MKLLTLSVLKREITNLFDEKGAKTIADYKRELLVKTGRQQFEALQKLGLNVPVSVL